MVTVCCHQKVESPELDGIISVVLHVSPDWVIGGSQCCRGFVVRSNDYFIAAALYRALKWPCQTALRVPGKSEHRPHEYHSIMFLQPNTPVPYAFGQYANMHNGLVFPPIQMHNYSSRPYAIPSGDPYYSQNGHVEYHHFYGSNPLYSMPGWPYGSFNTGQSYSPWMNYSNTQVHPKPAPNTWPEGFTMKGELQWGRLDRVFGVRRELPEFVKEDLRRVYGTYPRTFVSITYQNGEYLVKGDPKVGEQEYTIEKKVIRREPTPTDSEEEVTEDKSRKRRRRKARR